MTLNYPKLLAFLLKHLFVFIGMREYGLQILDFSNPETSSCQGFGCIICQRTVNIYTWLQAKDLQLFVCLI